MKKIIFLSFAFFTLSACSATNAPESESKPSESLIKTSRSSEPETTNTIAYDFPSIPTEVTIKTILYTDHGQKETEISVLTNPLELSTKTGKVTLNWLSDSDESVKTRSDSAELMLTIGKGTYELDTSNEAAKLNEDNKQLAFIFEINDSLTLTKLNEPYKIAMVGSTSDTGDGLRSSGQILKSNDFKETAEFKQYERVTIISLEFN